MTMILADALADLPMPLAASRLRDGTLSSMALTEACLDRIACRDPTLRAFVTVSAERARADAAQADAAFSRGEDRGPMQGIPYALKDLIETESIRTTAGSRLRTSHVPVRDAAIASRLRAAGAVLLGKLATYEWAVVGPDETGPMPPARNPWNVERITGGSSSGCAAAVAGGMLRTAFGTNTGGSIRSPAAYCGVVGLKPGFGRVSVEGVWPLAPSMDCVGPLSATVAEAALSLDAIADPAIAAAPAASRLGHSASGLRIGYARRFHVDDPEVSPELVTALDDAASALSLLGVAIEEIHLPDYALFEQCGAVILHQEAYALHASDLVRHGALYGRQVFASLASGCLLDAGDHDIALRARRLLTAAVEDALRGRHALLLAGVLQTAPAVAEFRLPKPRWTPMRTITFNVTGHPALAMPIGIGRDGLPLGLQLAGRHHEEAVLCQIGDALEQTTDWNVPQPPFPFDRPASHL